MQQKSTNNENTDAYTQTTENVSNAILLGWRASGAGYNRYNDLVPTGIALALRPGILVRDNEILSTVWTSIFDVTHVENPFLNILDNFPPASTVS